MRQSDSPFYDEIRGAGTFAALLSRHEPPGRALSGPAERDAWSGCMTKAPRREQWNRPPNLRLWRLST